MNKEIVKSLLKEWCKKNERMEIELRYCSEHNFDLEAKRIHSNIVMLTGCKIELEDIFAINTGV